MPRHYKRAFNAANIPPTPDGAASALADIFISLLLFRFFFSYATNKDRAAGAILNYL